MRELIAAELNEDNHPKAKVSHGSGHGPEGDDEQDGGKKGSEDKSWLNFEASPGPGRREKKCDMDRKTDMDENENDKEERQESPNGYAALKGQGVRMKPRGQGDVSKERRRVVDHDNGEDEGSDFF